jgi:SAM-dependent MidA family methyltransferase
VAEAASEAGLTVAGYCSQTAFLLASGIEAELAEPAGDARRAAQRAAEARALLMQDQMGEVFKAMALTRGVEAPPVGFGLQDLRRTL